MAPIFGLHKATIDAKPGIANEWGCHGHPSFRIPWQLSPDVGLHRIPDPSYSIRIGFPPGDVIEPQAQEFNDNDFCAEALAAAEAQDVYKQNCFSLEIALESEA